MYNRRGIKLVSGLCAAAACAVAFTFLPAPAAGEDNLVAHVAEGRVAFVKVCGACHGIDKPEKKNMDRPAWDELITSMEAKPIDAAIGVPINSSRIKRISQDTVYIATPQSIRKIDTPSSTQVTTRMTYKQKFPGFHRIPAIFEE